jgi:hypothetical protein
MQRMPADAESHSGLGTLKRHLYGDKVRNTSIPHRMGLPTAETKGPWSQPHVDYHSSKTSGVIPSPAASDAEHPRCCNTPAALVVLDPTRLRNAQVHACGLRPWLQMMFNYASPYAAAHLYSAIYPARGLVTSHALHVPWCIYGILILTSRLLGHSPVAARCKRPGPLGGESTQPCSHAVD